MTRSNLFIFVIVFFSGLGAQAQQTKLEPLIPDRSLTIFLDDLKYAVKTKDRQWIINNLDPDIKFSFGDEGGAEAFIQLWKFDETSDFWKIMERILDMGGGKMRSEDSYFMPYVFSHWPDEFDAFEYMAITGTNVNVRNKPSTSGSKVLGQFSYDIVQYDGNKSISNPDPDDIKDYSWYYVSAVDGSLKGFVYGDFVWSPIDYRIGFQKVDKKWVIKYFIAGD